MTISSNKPIRCFIAADPGQAVRDELQHLQKRIAGRLAGTSFKVKWVAPQAMHLTLLFLGDQPEERITSLFQTLEKTSQMFPRFGMSLTGAGFFGKKNSPRVVWAGMEAPSEFMELQTQLVKNILGLGIELDERPFHPHFTLGRVKAGRGPELFRALGETEVNPVPFDISSVELIQSELTPEGAVYTVLGSASLKGS